jgi:membrane associated rhomboid family serine protease
MGIYDREYYRREGPSFLGSISNTGQVCKWLIGINVVAFVIQVLSKPAGLEGFFDLGWFTNLFDLNCREVANGQVWRLLTYAFLHSPDNPWHIVWNMLFLWWFGTDVEDIYGPREFLAFYLTAAFLGGLGFFAGYVAGVPFHSLALGASGAVTAVLVVCACHYPTRVILVFMILPVPIWLFVVISVGIDAYQLLNLVRALRAGVPVEGLRTGTAVTVHLAGAAFALVYYKQQWRVLYLTGWLTSWLRQRQRNRPRLRVYREEPPQPVPVAAPPPAPPSDVDEHLEAQLDAVLEKVARYGQSSLTESERQVLLRASEVYKKRRT